MSTNVVGNEDHDRGLWASAGYGLLGGVIVTTALAAALIFASAPAMDNVARIAFALFVGVVGGPFFGMTAGVAYHELRSRTVADHRPATGDGLSPRPAAA